MLGYFRNLFDSGSRSPRKGGPLMPEPRGESRPGLDRGPRQQTFTKMFRYRLPDGQTAEPAMVEVVGSFTHWRPLALTRDGKLDSWHVIVHHIPGNRTHHYMLLVDGKPTYDAACDGLAVPHGAAEEQYQLTTDRGARVLMLFAQTR